jgi:hypothetical protein
MDRSIIILRLLGVNGLLPIDVVVVAVVVVGR